MILTHIAVFIGGVFIGFIINFIIKSSTKKIKTPIETEKKDEEPKTSNKKIINEGISV